MYRIFVELFGKRSWEDKFLSGRILELILGISLLIGSFCGYNENLDSILFFNINLGGDLSPGTMPAVRGDGMRGLAVFISDIRNCKYLKHSRLIIMLLFFKLYWEIICLEILPYS